MDLKYVHSILLLLVAMVTSQHCETPTSTCSCFVDNGLKVVDCRYRNMTHVPSFTLNGMIYDKIVFTSIEDTGHCSSNDCNGITTLPAYAFINLNVRVIDLRSNAIRIFDPNAFRTLENILNGLLIEGDGAVAPPYDSIEVLQSLRSLHLENFQQNDMTASNTNFTFPELLTLTLNKMHGVNLIAPQVFSTIPKVTELNMEHMPSLFTLPVTAILALQNLQTITIIDTKISRIYDDSFVSLSNLRSLHLDRNEHLTTIDANAFNGIEDTLEFLFLNQNQLTSSVLNMFSTKTWSSLIQLYLGYNTFNTFGSIPPGTFRTMPKLAFLEIQDSGLTSIDSTMFSGLSNLHTLDVGYNNIESVGTATFQNTPNLKELRLNDQSTHNTPILFASEAFKGIELSLERLYIERNILNSDDVWAIVKSFSNILEINMAQVGLAAIPDRAFHNNTRLSKLDLSENNIKSLAQESFYGPRDTLTTINLETNQISTINGCLFSDFANQPLLRLADNPLVCNCLIAWFYDWVISQTDPSVVNMAGYCMAPDNLKYKFFNQFSRSDLGCAPDYVAPVCPDLYSTTTTTATTTTTTSRTPGTTRPKPTYKLYIRQKTPTSIELTWTITDKTYLSGYLLEMSPIGAPKVTRFLNKDIIQSTFDNLQPGHSYSFCLILQLNGMIDYSVQQCKTASTSGVEIVG